MHLLIYIFYLYFFCAAIDATTLIRCTRFKLNHGRVRMKPNSKFARFICNKGYMLIGSKYSGCIGGYFDTNPPVCVNNKPNCKKIPDLQNGLILPEANKVVVHFFCKLEYTLIGSNMTICDGNNWLYQLPSCKQNGTKPETSCDFEDPDICGWSHDLNHDFDWKRTNSGTPSSGTGPLFDHTRGEQENGHYMYVESTSRTVNDSSRLISPIYGKMSQICVSFYYHMYGKDMGTLNVYIKQENESFEMLRPYFSVDGNQGDLWHLGRISLENGTKASFQVIFEGLRGASYLSDIAIDDVSIEEDLCPEEVSQTTETQYSTETSEAPFLDSCLNRCGENVTNFDDISTCSCDENCFELNLCCADFIQYCLLGTSSDYEDVTETSTIEISSDTTESDTTTELTTIPLKISTIPIVSVKKTTFPTTKSVAITIPQVNLKKITKSTTQKRTPTTKTTTTTTSTTPKTSTTKTTTTTTSPTTKTTTTTTSPTPRTPKTRRTTPTTTDFQVLTDKTSIFQPQIETDFLTSQQPDVQYLQQDTKNGVKSNNLIVYLGVIASVAFVTIIVSAIVFVKRKDLNCRKFTGSRNNDSMSDVRFLASDEVLDFTWKRAESL